MELHQIVAFHRIAQERSITKAAAGLYMSQAALSAKIRVLENELGKKLFVRRGHGVELSDAGRAFEPYAEQILLLLRDSTHAVRTAGSSPTSLSIACTYSVAMSFLPDALDRFSHLHPSVNVSIQAGASNAIFELILSRIVQMGIIARDLRAKGIERVLLGTEPILLVAAPTHPLAQVGKVDLDSLANHRLILSNWGSGYDSFLERIHERLGHRPPPEITMDPTHAAMKMAQQGLGVCFLPKTIVVDELLGGTLKCIEINDLPPVKRELWAIYYPQQKHSAPVAVMIESLKAAMEKLLDDLPGAQG